MEGAAVMNHRSSEHVELDLRVVIHRIVVRMQSPASTPRMADETTGALLAAVRDAVGPRRSSQ